MMLNQAHSLQIIPIDEHSKIWKDLEWDVKENEKVSTFPEVSTCHLASPKSQVLAIPNQTSPKYYVFFLAGEHVYWIRVGLFRQTSTNAGLLLLAERAACIVRCTNTTYLREPDYIVPQHDIWWFNIWDVMHWRTWNTQIRPKWAQVSESWSQSNGLILSDIPKLDLLYDMHNNPDLRVCTVRCMFSFLDEVCCSFGFLIKLARKKVSG